MQYPTFCGKIIPLELATYISPFKNGVSMRLPFFSQYVELIKNILLLSTQIDLYTTYRFHPTQKPDDYSEINLVKYFIDLLYQPYVSKESINKKMNFVLGGDTPLSRFTQNYHEFLSISGPYPFTEDYIQKYNRSILNLGLENESILNSPSTVQTMLEQKDDLHTPLKQSIHLKKSTAKSIMDAELMDNLLNRTLTSLHFIDPKDSSVIDKNNKLYNSISDAYLHTLRKTLEEFAYQDYDYNISEKFAEDSISYIPLFQMLIKLEDYFTIKYISTSEISISFSNSENPSYPDELLKQICKYGKELIADIINTYIININYEVVLEPSGNYNLQLKSSSLLQSIFLEMANILNSYQVTICKLPSCKRLAISPKTRPAVCCCKSHSSAYKRWRERRS